MVDVMPARCPVCRYELAGVPTRICPECGSDAVAEHEHRIYRRRLRRSISPDWLLVAGAVPLSVLLDSRFRGSGDEENALLLAAMIYVVAGVYWLWSARLSVLVCPSPRRLVLFALTGTAGAWFLSA